MYDWRVHYDWAFTAIAAAAAAVGVSKATVRDILKNQKFYKNLLMTTRIVGYEIFEDAFHLIETQQNYMHAYVC